MKFASLKEHRYLLAVVVAAAILYAFFFHNRLYGEINGSFISYGLVMKDAYLGGAMPHWTPLLSGGYPLLSNPEIPSFGILNLMVLILPSVILAFSMTLLIHLLIAGIGAALLSFEFTKSRHAAVVSGTLFIISGSFSYAIFSGTMPFLFPLAFLPWVLLFSYRAMKERPVANGIVASSALAMQLLSGGTIYFFWTLLGVGVFSVVYALFSLLRGKLAYALKSGAVIAGIVAFALGFAAVKLLPALSFIGLTNRAAGVDYASFVWSFTQISMSKLPASLLFTASMAKVGVVAMILAVIGFALGMRKKFGIAFLAMAVVAVLIETGTFLTRIFFALPGFGQTRQIYNVLALLSIAIAVMAGFGWEKLRHLSLPLKKFPAAATAIVLLIIAAELFMIEPEPSAQPWEHDFSGQLQQNYLLQNVSNDSSMFRLHVYGEDFVGLSLAKYAVPFSIRMFDWTTGNVWFNDYSQYTTVAGQLNSARMWGMANVKYVASRQPIEVPGLEFVAKFGDCINCDLKAAFLYRNSEFLPEAYLVRNATLFIGDGQNNFQNTYAIINDPNFAPSRAAIVNLPAVPLSMDKYGLVMPATTKLSQGDLSRLQLYSASGIVEPRIFDSESHVDYNVISSYFSSSSPVEEAEIVSFAPQKVVVKAPGKGLLVLGEKFYKFGDWKASIDGKDVAKLNVNIISTGVFADKGDVVTFSYTPSKYNAGLLATLASMVVAAAFLLAERKLIKKGSKAMHHETQ